ncbi:MAG: PadR family transcriptional regulator [Lysobacterales bacterium]
MALPKDLVAASATPLVLSILAQGDSYGYAIIQQVKTLSDGELEWADGMLYPILHRLEKRALIEAYWGRSQAGRRRKYYRLLDAGGNELVDLRDQWESMNRLLKTFSRPDLKTQSA